MSYDGGTNKPGKRKLTNQKGKSSSSSKSPKAPATPPPAPAPLPDEPLPGTNVNIDAYIWQENVEAGLVVMNVKWRGKTYCGAFIDIEKHNWQPPRLGEAVSPDADHFTRGKNKRSLNSECSEKGDEDTPTKRGRNKGKKKRGPPPGIKKVKKSCNTSENTNTEPSAPQSPTNSVTSTEDRKSTDPEEKEIKKEPEKAATPEEETTVVPVKKEETIEETTAPEDKTKVVITKAPDMPILPDTPEPNNSHSVINSYSPHSKKVNTSTPTITSNKLTPIPKELYGSDSVIRSFSSKSPLNQMIKPELLQAPTPPIKPFLNPSPRSLSGMITSRPNNIYHVENEISASKPQVIVKPERREIRPEMNSSFKSTGMPVLKPQPHFTSPDNRPSLHTMVSSTGSVMHPSLHTSAPLSNLVGSSPSSSFYKEPKKAPGMEQFMPFKPTDKLGQMGHAFKNAALFSGMKPGVAAGQQHGGNPFAQLQRHYFPNNAMENNVEKTEIIEQGGGHSSDHHRPTNQEAAAQSLLQLSRPFSPKTTPLDQLQYLSRLQSQMLPNSMLPPHQQQPPTSAPYPPPRFPTDSKEDIAKFMSFQAIGPRFPLVEKFR